MTQNEFKVGDRVRHLGFNLCGIITDFLGEGFVKVKAIDDEVFSTWDINNLELCDRKTAFLTELQALLRKYDAKIESCAEGTEDSWIDIYFGDECVICFDRNQQTCCATITADNIMDFDKE